jgi:hypothetical protein
MSCHPIDMLNLEKIEQAVNAFFFGHKKAGT